MLNRRHALGAAELLSGGVNAACFFVMYGSAIFHLHTHLVMDVRGALLQMMIHLIMSASQAHCMNQI